MVGSTCNWSCLDGRHMKPLTQYGLLAEKHWRAWRPRMVAELERTGRLHALLLEAEERTEAELDQLRRYLIKQGLTPQQAHDQAWEMVRERYIYLPPEESRLTKQPRRNRSLSKQ